MKTDPLIYTCRPGRVLEHAARANHEQNLHLEFSPMTSAILCDTKSLVKLFPTLFWESLTNQCLTIKLGPMKPPISLGVSRDMNKELS